MKPIRSVVIFILVMLAEGCITEFIPQTDEIQDLVVVEGLITDQDQVNTIKLSKAMPLGQKSTRQPMRGCSVMISDDKGNFHYLTETAPGIYTTNQQTFRGVAGRKYTLHINSNNARTDHHTYVSSPVELTPVPAVDSVFYDKVVITEQTQYFPRQEGCQIYLNTHDLSGQCKFFRWDYTETWEIRLPFSVPVNHTCWVTSNSNVINIKSTASLSENRISRYPLKFVSNETDRLKFKYSVLVNQYSLSEDEFNYWEKLQNVSQDIGSLYDIIPATIPGNIFCVEDPGEKVLGYFSVSAKSSKRLFIKDNFRGIVNPYSGCIADTIFNNGPIPNLNISVWILEQTYPPSPPARAITYIKGCADCTVRGSIIKPDFWDETK
jgi:hypothetical protein